MKRFMKKVVKEFIFGGHMTALQSPALLASLMLLGGYTLNIALLAIPYFVSQLVYSYNHFREISFDKDSNPERTNFIKDNNKKQKILFAGYFLGLVLVLFFTNIKVSILTIIVLIAGLLYTEYFKTLKITGFKNYYIAITWSSILFILPFNYDVAITTTFVLTVIAYCLTAFTNTVFFDVKDVESDAERDIRTFPVVLGLRRTELMLYFVKLASIFLVILGVYLNVLQNIFLFYILPILYSVIYINRGLRLQSKKLRIVTYLVAEAEFTFWLLILIAIKLL